jgi:hypothetical protein
MATEAQNTQYAIHNTLHEINSTNYNIFPNTLFMQNKANFQKAIINVNSYMKSIYENSGTCWNGKTNPIQSQFKPNLSQFNPKQTQLKPKQTQFIERLKMNLFAWIGTLLLF